MNEIMPKEFYIERNKEILSLYNSGNSLKKIGEIHKISTERVRQIIEKYNHSKEEHSSIMKSKRQEEGQKQINIDYIKKARLQHKTWDFICKELNIKYASLKKYIILKNFPRTKKEGYYYCSICKSYFLPSEGYLARIGKYITYRHKPCTNKYNAKWRNSRKVENHE